MRTRSQVQAGGGEPMGRVTNGLHKASSTLSWVRSQLPKPPQLYVDRYARPHEVNPLVSPNWQQAPG